MSENALAKWTVSLTHDEDDVTIEAHKIYVSKEGHLELHAPGGGGTVAAFAPGFWKRVRKA